MTQEWLHQEVTIEQLDSGMSPMVELSSTATQITQVWLIKLSSILIAHVWPLAALIRKSKSLIADRRDSSSTMMPMMTASTQLLSTVLELVWSLLRMTIQSRFGILEKAASCTLFMDMREQPLLPTSLQKEITSFLEEMTLWYFAGNPTWTQSRVNSLILKQRLKLKFSSLRRRRLINFHQLEEPRWANLLRR